MLNKQIWTMEYSFVLKDSKGDGSRWQAELPLFTNESKALWDYDKKEPRATEVAM